MKIFIKDLQGKMDRCLLGLFLTITPWVYFPMFRHNFLWMRTHNPNIDYDDEEKEGYQKRDKER